jgi:hypothetical protein
MNKHEQTGKETKQKQNKKQLCVHVPVGGFSFRVALADLRRTSGAKILVQ